MNWCTVTVAPTIEHHGGHSRTPAKPEVRPGAREESASPAWLAAPAMNARDTTKVYIWRLDTVCGLTLYRKCHSRNTPGKKHNNTWVEPLAGNCTTSSTRQREQVWQKCKIQMNWCTVTVAPTKEHHGGHSRTPAKPEVRPGAREESASPAWLAAPAMNARDTTKVYIWRLNTVCGLTLYRKCHSRNTPYINNSPCCHYGSPKLSEHFSKQSVHLHFRLLTVWKICFDFGMAYIMGDYVLKDMRPLSGLTKKVDMVAISFALRICRMG